MGRVLAGRARPVPARGAGFGRRTASAVAVAAAAVAALATCGFPPLPRLDPPGGWMTPRKLGGVNTMFVEDDPSFTSDRSIVVFTSRQDGSGGSNNNTDIFLATRANPDADFGNVVALKMLNTSKDEHSPEITSDGTKIYFTATRPPFMNRHVYLSIYNGGWQSPTLVSALSPDDTMEEKDVAISPDELTAMIARNGEFLIAHRNSPTDMFGEPEPVPSLIVPGLPGYIASAPSITNDANAVYFEAGSGSDDNDRKLYYAKRVEGRYTTPVELMEIDDMSTVMPGRNSGPFISADEHHMMFSHGYDIYEIAR